MVRGILAFSILAFFLILTTGCQNNGTTNLWQSPGVSGEAEALLGQRAAPALEDRFGGIAPHSIAVDRMQMIGRRLATSNPELNHQWHFHVLASDRINAFSLPGGLIYITRGLYERRIGDDNDLLAAVIAHEMGHVVNKDSLKRSCPDTRQALDREISADGCAARYLVSAGYNVRCLRNLLQMIKDVQPPGWADARIQALDTDGNVASGNPVTRAVLQ